VEPKQHDRCRRRPHPNPRKAAEGYRLRVLAIDEPSAAVVRRIFAEERAAAQAELSGVPKRVGRSAAEIHGSAGAS
jgi:hypothetical protein